MAGELSLRNPPLSMSLNLGLDGEQLAIVTTELFQPFEPLRPFEPFETGRPPPRPDPEPDPDPPAE